MNKESECFTVISKHEKAMYENTSAKRECFHTLFLSVWRPGETRARVVYLANGFSNESRHNRMFSFADLNRILNLA